MTTTDLVKDWLHKEGFKCEMDADGDLQFKYQGLHMFCSVDKNDPLFFRILVPNIYEVENNRAKVMEALNTVTRDIKVVKAFLVEDRVWLAIEMFIDTTPDIDDFVERCLDILVASRERFVREMLA